MDVKIVSVIIGALLGSGLSAIGFYFKSRREVKEKINQSLFQLLEVWSLIAIVKVTSSDKFHTKLLGEIKDKFPHENITENDKKLLKEGMVKAMPMIAGVDAKLDGQFLIKYKTSVNELAKIYPLLAFDLNRNQMLIQFLGAIDKLVVDSPISDKEEAQLANMRNLMIEETFRDLEKDLLTLSSFSGYGNKTKTKSHINRIKNRLDSMPSDVFDEYIEKVISPAIQAHYDNLGIKNPNTVKSQKPNKAMQATDGVGA